MGQSRKEREIKLNMNKHVKERDEVSQFYISTFYILDILSHSKPEYVTLLFYWLLMYFTDILPVSNNQNLSPRTSDTSAIPNNEGLNIYAKKIILLITQSPWKHEIK